MEELKLPEESRIREIYHFIRACDVTELAVVLEAIRGVHDNLMVWNPNTRGLDTVKDISINGNWVQLNIGVDRE